MKIPQPTNESIAYKAWTEYQSKKSNILHMRHNVKLMQEIAKNHNTTVVEMAAQRAAYNVNNMVSKVTYFKHF